MFKLTSRKLWINLGIIVTTFIFIWFGKVSDATGLTLIGATAGIYTAGNVKSKINK